VYTVKQTHAFSVWLEGIEDGMTRRRLARRLEKAQSGNFGDVALVGEGVSEMREHFGSGWRRYYIQQGSVVIVMLGCGTKRTQKADITAAKKLAKSIEGSIMARKIKNSELKTFDMAEHLDTDKAIAEYIAIVLEENDPAALADALGTVARARGMADVAKSAGIAREALYKALRPGSQPRFETIQRVCVALGVRLTVVPA